MSSKAVDIVFDCGLEPNEKLVALVYAHEVDDEGKGFRHSYTWIAAKTSLKRRSVIRIVKRLEQAGILSGERDQTNCPKWSLHIDALQKLILSESDIVKRTQPIAKRVRQLLIDRDGEQCSVPLCDTGGDLGIDHILARSKGGTDDLSNLHLLCRSHNSQKGTSSWNEFLDRLTGVSS